jgi:adenosine deaminase
MSLADYIRAMPKAEVHVHMEGSVQPETLLELAERNGIELPCATVEEVRALFNFRDFNHFAETLLMTVRCLRRPEDFSVVIHRLGAELIRQNIRYAEVTWTPQFYLRLGLPLGVLLEALNDGRRRARQEWGVEMRWIPDLVRSVPQPMNHVQRWASSEEAMMGGVVALGLGGPEAGHPPERFETPFRRARNAGLPANPHAGETAGPASVWGALEALKAARIGHGVRAIEDPELLRYLAAHNVPLEICPTSNLCLSIYPSYAVHPLKRLVEAGCVVTINSDDPPLFGTTLSEEYFHAVEDCGLTLDQLEEAALNAVRVSYLPDGEKAAMLEEFTAEYARLRVRHGMPCPVQEKR